MAVVWALLFLFLVIFEVSISIASASPERKSRSDSGVAARYSRLGVSVRQGQKVKLRLLEEGLIDEQIETTHAGRLAGIQLTDQGERLLAATSEAT
jgi:hypothetical protein